MPALEVLYLRWIRRHKIVERVKFWDSRRHEFPGLFPQKMVGAGKGPGIGWSRVQPKYSREANLYATRWFCTDGREKQFKIITSRKNLRAGCKSASSQEWWQVADLKHLKTSYAFSLPRIGTKDFPYIKEKIDWSIGINYSSVDFKRTQIFLCCQSFNSRGQWIFSKIRVIQDKSKPTRVVMVWLRVKVNRTRLCTAAHFARNEIKYQKSRESGLFQYNLYARTIACLSVITLYKQKFHKCYSLSPS